MRNLPVALTLSFLLLFASAAIGQRVEGNGTIKSENRSHSGFTGVDVGSAFHVYLSQGSSYQVRIEADENLLSHIQTEVKNGTLRIRTDRNVRKSKSLKAYVTLPKLDHLNVSGASHVKGESAFKTDKMEIEASGASHLTLELQAQAMICELSGATHVSLSGRVDEMGISTSGASHFNGKKLEGESAKVDGSGASQIHLSLSNSIEGDVSGATHIYCNGNPNHSRLHTSGASKLHMQ